MELTFDNPKFKSEKEPYQSFVTFPYGGGSGGTLSISSVTYETTTQVLTVKAHYKRVGFNSQGVYLSLNNDRTSMGNGTQQPNSYNAVIKPYAQKLGMGECYAVRKTHTSTVTLTSSSSYDALSPLRSGGGSSTGEGVTGVDLTVSSVVSPAVIVAGNTPIFIRVMYDSGWKAIEDKRWIANEGSYTRELSTDLIFDKDDLSKLKAYVITYDGKGGSTPFDQIKYHDETIYLDETWPVKDTVHNADSYTVSFNGNGGTPSKSSILSTKDVAYTFKEWVSTKLSTSFQPGDSYSNNDNDELVAYYIQSATQHPITLPTATRLDELKQRVVKYNTNGGTGTLSNGTSHATVTYGFKGWYPSTSSEVKSGNAGASYTPNSTHTLYARWTSSTGAYSSITLPTIQKDSVIEVRTITFDANGGSVHVPSIQSTATRSYTLDGWYTASSGGIMRGKGGASYTPLYDEETLYAQFSSSIGTYSREVLPLPTRTNYTFKGWSTIKGATQGNVESPYRPSGNITLYATWEEDQAKSFVRDSNGNWRKGKIFVLDSNGVWKKAKKLYIKQEDGSWKLGKNS